MPGRDDGRVQDDREHIEPQKAEQADLEPVVMPPIHSNADIANAAQAVRAGREREPEEDEEVVVERRQFTADAGADTRGDGEANTGDPPAADDPADDPVQTPNWGLASAPPPVSPSVASGEGSWLTPRKPKDD